ncbi:hypothetical protein [Actinophytocola oryzae]|uniref:hypothetical protein n=1 Tax=Actinophytocola oryzae TaxID=502181 RepID=UPI001FBAE60A|nr:hypothetical protein [Actinophytocola oryzae]
MGSDLASENDPGNRQSSGDASDFVIPSPRPAPDDDIAGLPTPQPETGSDDPAQWYDQPRKRGTDRRYWSEVEWIGGPEGDRLREKLSEIVRDLLQWAHDEQKKSETDSSADSGEDGDTDDTPA